MLCVTLRLSVLRPISRRESISIKTHNPGRPICRRECISFFLNGYGFPMGNGSYPFDAFLLIYIPYGKIVPQRFSANPTQNNKEHYLKQFSKWTYITGI